MLPIVAEMIGRGVSELPLYDAAKAAGNFESRGYDGDEIVENAIERGVLTERDDCVFFEIPSFHSFMVAEFDRRISSSRPRQAVA